MHTSKTAKNQPLNIVITMFCFVLGIGSLRPRPPCGISPPCKTLLKNNEKCMKNKNNTVRRSFVLSEKI